MRIITFTLQWKSHDLLKLLENNYPVLNMFIIFFAL